jgi:hypothetical protein
MAGRRDNFSAILGSDQLKLEGIPKQFLYYPLMETAEIGINFVIHANDFKPNKERDYLHRNKENTDLKKDVQRNETLLQTAFDLVVEKVSDDETLSLMDISNIKFVVNETAFDISLKCNYINTIKSLERIEIAENKYAIDSFSYFDSSLLLIEEEIKKALYLVLNQFQILPGYEDYCTLSELANNWNEHISDKLTTLSIADIGKVVADEAGGDYFYIADSAAYQKVVIEMAKDLSLVNDLALIPNIHGSFMLFEDLVKWDQPEPNLIQVVDAIEAAISEKYIHPDFENLENVNAYNREKFKDDFSNFCNDLIDDISKGKEIVPADSVRYAMLNQSLKIFVGLNKRTQLNSEVAGFYERVYDLGPEEMEIAEPTVHTNFQPAIKLLAHLYIKGLKKNEAITQHLDDLKEIVAAMYRNTNLKEELLHKLACIPNQKLILKSQMELKKTWF